MPTEIVDVKQAEGLCQDREGWSSNTWAVHRIINALWHISRLCHEATTSSLLQFPIHSTDECGPTLNCLAVNGMGANFLNIPIIEMPV